MLKDFKNGGVLLKDAAILFKHHPILALPIFLVATIEAAIVIYFEFYFEKDIYSTIELFLIAFGLVFLFSFILTFSCSVLVELIKHIETTNNPSLIKATRDTIFINLWRLGLISFVWAIIDFILLIIQAIFSRDNKESDGERETNAKNIAATLSGQDSKFSLLEYGIKLLRKKIRMMAFLTIPAISWDNLSAGSAARKSLNIVRSNLTQFFSGFLLTEAAAVIIFFVPGIIFYLDAKELVSFNDAVWNAVILYCVIGMSVYYYLEQMFCAELYLWHKKYENEVEKAKTEGREPPEHLREVDRPSLLDEIPDLLEQDSAGTKK